MKKDSEVIRPEVVAAAAEVTVATVCRWANEGRLPEYDMNLGRKFRGWKLDTLATHNPRFGKLIEDYLRDQETAQ